MRISTQIVKEQSALPPIKAIEAHVAGVGDAGELIPHDLPRDNLSWSGFEDGHTGGKRLVCHLESDDLPLMLQIRCQLLELIP